jgi:hypothetical protein
MRLTLRITTYMATSRPAGIGNVKPDSWSSYGGRSGGDLPPGGCALGPQSGRLMLSSPYPRLPLSCGRACTAGAGTSINALQILRTINFVKPRTSWAMSHSLSFVQRTVRGSRWSRSSLAEALTPPECEPESQRPRTRAPRSSRSSCSWTIRSYD